VYKLCMFVIVCVCVCVCVCRRVCPCLTVSVQFSILFFKTKHRNSRVAWLAGSGSEVLSWRILFQGGLLMWLVGKLVLVLGGRGGDEKGRTLSFARWVSLNAVWVSLWHGSWLPPEQPIQETARQKSRYPLWPSLYNTLSLPLYSIGYTDQP